MRFQLRQTFSFGVGLLVTAAACGLGDANVDRGGNASDDTNGAIRGRDGGSSHGSDAGSWTPSSDAGSSNPRDGGWYGPRDAGSTSPVDGGFACYSCSTYGYSPGQCSSGWYCDGTCIEYTGCTSSYDGGGYTPYDGGGWPSYDGGSTSCTYLCTDYGYSPGQCVIGWYCDGTCVEYTGCASSVPDAGPRKRDAGW